MSWTWHEGRTIPKCLFQWRKEKDSCCPYPTLNTCAEELIFVNWNFKAEIFSIMSLYFQYSHWGWVSLEGGDYRKFWQFFSVFFNYSLLTKELRMFHCLVHSVCTSYFFFSFHWEFEYFLFFCVCKFCKAIFWKDGKVKLINSRFCVFKRKICLPLFVQNCTVPCYVCKVRNSRLYIKSVICELCAIRRFHEGLWFFHSLWNGTVKSIWGPSLLQWDSRV